MSWSRTADTERRIEWERSDGYARVTARETATGDWAVALDRLKQAPDGAAYDHRTVDDRDRALAVAEEWLAAHDIE
ncbi:DUF7543 family protein [Halorarius halobius]|uniref:DUF7543 family protein n=1 Tax=Halorarius halobius TaxID=2962671 RepID=UPI0020CD818D|nr:hypothetical protein [Halorarius halobius]